jgi:hypothetical protein
LSQAQATMQAAGQKAGAYFSSWGAWAAEKRKTGWRSEASPESQPSKTIASEKNQPPTRTNGPSITVTPAKELNTSLTQETGTSSKKERKTTTPATIKDEAPPSV